MPFDAPSVVDISLRDVMPAAPPGVAEEWEAALEAAMAEFEINTPQRMAGFLASIANETGQLHKFEEIGWFYTPYDRAKAMFGIACPPYTLWADWKLLGPLAFNIRFFNWVYDDANRGGNDLGNKLPGEGHKYRGLGPGQITGKYNMERIGNALGLDLVGNPEQLKQPVAGSRSFAYYWRQAGNNERLDRGDVRGAMKVMNSGLKDFTNHLNQYRRILQVMMALPKPPPATRTQAVIQASTGRTGVAAAVAAAGTSITITDVAVKATQAKATVETAKGLFGSFLPSPYTEIALGLIVFAAIAYGIWRYSGKLLRGDAYADPVIAKAPA